MVTFLHLYAMGTTNTSFNAGVIAAIGSILGVALLFSSMLAFLSESQSEFMLLSGSAWVTATVGVMLALTGGLLATGYRQGRFIGTLSFGAVVVFGINDLLSTMDPVLAVAVGIAGLLTLYMMFRNPVPRPERSPIDESESASRVGSTLR